MKRQQIVECAIAIGLIALIAIAAGSFYSRYTTGGHPITTATYSGEKPKPLTTQTLTFVDNDGNTTLAIHAGPPATLEIRDNKGNMQTVDLSKLPSKLRLFGEGKE